MIEGCATDGRNPRALLAERSDVNASAPKFTIANINLSLQTAAGLFAPCRIFDPDYFQWPCASLETFLIELIHDGADHTAR
jgi:hypothetical protein